MRDAAVPSGPVRLLRRLTDAGADFRVVGSVARGVRAPGDLDIAVEAGPELDRVLDAVRSVGGTSTLSVRLPTAVQLGRAGMWHFETAECALDVFVVDREASPEW